MCAEWVEYQGQFQGVQWHMQYVSCDLLRSSHISEHGAGMRNQFGGSYFFLVSPCVLINELGVFVGNSVLLMIFLLKVMIAKRVMRWGEEKIWVEWFQKRWCRRTLCWFFSSQCDITSIKVEMEGIPLMYHCKYHIGDCWWSYQGG